MKKKSQPKMPLATLSASELAAHLRQERQKQLEETKPKTPYEIALAHLYEKRNQITSAIQIIEQLRNTYLNENRV